MTKAKRAKPKTAGAKTKGAVTGRKDARLTLPDEATLGGVHLKPGDRIIVTSPGRWSADWVRPHDRPIPTKPSEFAEYATTLKEHIRKLEGQVAEGIEQGFKAQHYERVNKQQARLIAELDRRLDHARFLAINVFANPGIDSGTVGNSAAPERDRDE